MTAREGGARATASRPWDVIIVGAGSAGSATAAQAARRGLRTLVIERRALERAGAHWVNGVYGKAFDEAGIARPAAPELRGGGHAFHLVAGWGPERLRVPDPGMLDVDMARLVARLRADALAAGAVFMDEARVDRIEPGRVHLAAGRLARGVELGRVVVDASGLGALFQPRAVHPKNVCAAAQAVYKLADRERAEAFFASLGAAPHEPLSFAAVAGGYSIVSARLVGEREVSILAGSLPHTGHPSGRALRDAFVARHADWIGPRVFGGEAPIPLGPPRRRLAHVVGRGASASAVTWLGDSAGHVYAAHGSGVGAQLVASRILADAVASEGPSGTRAFEARWHRRFGPTFAAADAFRRLSSRLGPRGLAALIRAGLLPRAVVRLGLTAGL